VETKIKKQLPYKEIAAVLIGGFIGFSVVAVTFKGQ
jgi:hypothetical protein